MRGRKVVALGAGLAMVSGLALAPGAGAQTAVEFTVNSGSLSISAPAAATLSLERATAGGMVFTGSLGTTTVTDERNSTGGWTVTASATDFVHDDDPGEVIPAANVEIGIDPLSAIEVSVSGALDALLGGAALFVPLPPVQGSGPIGSLVDIVDDLGIPLFSLLAISTNNEVDFAPDVTVTVPAGTPDGRYTATITQTAA